MKKNQRGSTELWVFGALIALLIIGGIVFAFFYAGSRSTADVHVKDKERITGEKSGYYLVYDDREVFAIKDTFVFGRFNSSDLYGQLEKGKSYRCDVAGWRLPFFSKYRNLIKCELKTEGQSAR
jgi:hypothetical protein